jgi:Short-chain dehydrogenases of various substrate specificities
MTLAMRTTMTRATVTVTRGRPTTTMTRATPVRARGDDATTTRSRRDALASVGLLCASVAFAARANEDDEEEGGKRKKRVVITGSNSGIGLDAANKLAASGEWTVALACLTRAEAEAAKREIFEYSIAVADDDV